MAKQQGTQPKLISKSAEFEHMGRKLKSTNGNFKVSVKGKPVVATKQDSVNFNSVIKGSVKQQAADKKLGIKSFMPKDLQSKLSDTLSAKKATTKKK